ncbi:hypothetical protein SVA_3882 [Sulfurifustis variabilis]|uniref:Uncharacterized protein n=1 Tax=Sulfurifustis variabilis TaxID=1675686 RepID=A0A1C7AG29_9GAMM|nr:hypothetical protein [Sulfurifustis variabilis]BAU50416.1 hypothetical protein SVA_3882 [Sulfurifustis variabilis]
MLKLMRPDFEKLCVAFVLWLGLVAGAEAQILDSLEVETTDEAAVLHVNFAVPVRYQKHIRASGKNLVVYLRVLDVADSVRREVDHKSLKAQPELVPATEVTFEPNGPQGPQLVFNFGQPMDFDVRQGRDNRSIDVIFRKPGAARQAAEKKNATPSRSNRHLSLSAT